jgi:hypothetical protein
MTTAQPNTEAEARSPLPSLEKQIDAIFEFVDWVRIQKVMELTDWTYWDGDGSTPTIWTLMKIAREHLERVYHAGHRAESASGGFYARNDASMLRLSFQIETVDAYELLGQEW